MLLCGTYADCKGDPGDFVINTDHKTPEQIAEEIKRIVDAAGGGLDSTGS